MRCLLPSILSTLVASLLLFAGQTPAQQHRLDRDIRETGEGEIRIFIACEPVDFRKAHDGLLAIVRAQFAEDPFAGSVFVFLNRKRDRVKILHWDRDGFWLHYKRLEKGLYLIALRSDAKRVELTRPELAMLLEGIDLKSGRIREPLHVPLRRRSHGRSGEHGDGSDTGGSRSSPV